MIAEQLQERGIGSKDFLVAKVPPSEVPRYLKASDMAISLIKPCYSKLSSSPTKIAEYLASGLPVIASATGGNLELVEHGVNGALIPPGDSAALAAAVSSYVRDGAKRAAHSAASRRRAEQHLSLGEMMKRYRELYRAEEARALETV